LLLGPSLVPRLVAVLLVQPGPQSKAATRFVLALSVRR
jgi:hypothetical protein